MMMVVWWWALFLLKMEIDELDKREELRCALERLLESRQMQQN